MIPSGSLGIRHEVMLEKVAAGAAVCDTVKADELTSFYRDGFLHWGVIIVAGITMIFTGFNVRSIIVSRRHRAIQVRSLTFSLVSAFAGTLCMLLIAIPHIVQDQLDKLSFVKGARFCDIALHLFALPLLFVPTVMRVMRVLGLHAHENAKRNFAGKLPLGLVGIPSMDFYELEQELVVRKMTFFSKGPMYWSIGLAVLLADYAILWGTLVLPKLSLKVEQLSIMSHTLAIVVLQLLAVLALHGRFPWVGRCSVKEAFSVGTEAIMLTVLTAMLYVVQILFFCIVAEAGEPAQFSFTWSGAYHATVLAVVAAGTIVSVTGPLVVARPPVQARIHGELHEPAELRELLWHPTGRLSFGEYLASTFTSEYYLFWRDVEEFKALKDEPIRLTAANLIYSVYCRDGGPMDLHLNPAEQINVRNQLNTIISPSIFDTSQAVILQRMASLFPRFLESEYAHRFLYGTTLGGRLRARPAGSSDFEARVLRFLEVQRKEP